jgi:hypothetical protein
MPNTLFSSRPYATDVYGESISCGRAEIIGTGPVGTDVDGPILLFRSAPTAGVTDGLVIGPSGGAYRCTGTKLRDFKLIRGGKLDGGDALKFVAVSDIIRPGQCDTHNVLIMCEADLRGGPAARWARGLVMDGSAVPTRGSAGVRDTFFSNMRISSCSTRDFVVLDTAVHARFLGLQIDPGRYAGSELPRILIHNCEHVYFEAAEINGAVEIYNSIDVQLRGFFHTVRLGGACRQVTIQGAVRNLSVTNGVDGYALVSGLETRENRSLQFKII